MWKEGTELVIKANQIAISEKGILVEEGHLLPWDHIRYAYPERQGVGKQVHDYLVIVHTEPKDGVEQVATEEIRTDYYTSNQEDISRAVNYWSGRKIGKQSDRFRDEVIEKKEGLSTQEKDALREKSDVFIPLFEKEKRKEDLSFPITFVFFSILFISFCLLFRNQLEGNLMGIVAISLFINGFSISIVVPYLLRRRFLKTPPIEELSQSEIIDFFRMASKGEYTNYKASILTSVVLTVAFVVWLIYIVYN